MCVWERRHVGRSCLLGLGSCWIDLAYVPPARTHKSRYLLRSCPHPPHKHNIAAGLHPWRPVDRGMYFRQWYGLVIVRCPRGESHVYWPSVSTKNIHPPSPPNSIAPRSFSGESVIVKRRQLVHNLTPLSGRIAYWRKSCQTCSRVNNWSKLIMPWSRLNMIE